MHSKSLAYLRGCYVRISYLGLIFSILCGFRKNGQNIRLEPDFSDYAPSWKSWICYCKWCSVQPQGCTQKGTPFVYTPYMYWKMVTYQNVTAVILVPVDDGPFVLVEKLHRFIQQHVLYCIGQVHAGSSLRVYYPHRVSSGHCFGRSGSQVVRLLCTCEDTIIL